MARSFNGSTNYLLPSGAFAGGTAGSFLLSWWMRTTTTATVRTCLGVAEDGTAGVVQVHLNSNNAGNGGQSNGTFLFVRDNSGNQNGGNFVNATVYDGNWHHHMLYRSGSNTFYYVDGGVQSVTYSSSALSANNISFARPLGIGARNLRGTMDTHANCEIAELAYYGGLPSVGDLEALAQGFSPLLVAPALLENYYPLLGRRSPETDLWGGSHATVSGASAAVHPRVYGPQAGQMSFVPAAATTHTATAALTLAPVQVAGTATHIPPTFTASAALTLPAAQASASGTHTPPTFTGLAALQTAPVTLAGSASHEAPTFTASAALQTAPVQVAAAGTTIAPVFTASAALQTAPVTMAASGTAADPVFTASAALVTAAVQVLAAGTSADPVYTAAAALTLAPATMGGLGASVPPVFTATAALSLAPATLSGIGSHAAPVFTGTAALVLAPAVVAGEASFVASIEFDYAGVEITVPSQRMHVTIPPGVLHKTVPVDRAHVTVPQEA